MTWCEISISACYSAGGCWGGNKNRPLYRVICFPVAVHEITALLMLKKDLLAKGKFLKKQNYIYKLISAYIKPLSVTMLSTPMTKFSIWKDAK